MARAIPVALAIAAACLVPAAAPAQDQASVVSAQAAGTVGERFDGYLGFPGAASAPLRRSVGAVNIKRRALYTSLSQRRGVSREEVGITAACQLLARTGRGGAYMLQDGVWRRRGANEGPPRPAYCGG